MTLARRLTKLEGGRSPRDIVLAWLDEAQAYPSLPEYVTSLLDGPIDAYPLQRIGSEVEAAVRGSTKGRPADVWEAVRSGVGDAFFSFEIVLQVNLAAEQLRRFEGLRWACLSYQARALGLEAELDALGQGVVSPERSAREADAWRTGVAGSLTILLAEDEVRTRLEARYLDGRPALFLGLARDWALLGERLQGLVALAGSLPELRGTGAVALDIEDLQVEAVELASTRLGELTTLAKASALDLLGESERAAAVVERTLRPNVVPTG